MRERNFSADEIINCLEKPTYIKTQADGATAHIKEITNNKFNIIIVNREGEVITALKNLTDKSLKKLSANYSWK